MNPAAQRQPSFMGNVYILHPSDVVCANRGDRLETLLGSCVAIVLTDPQRTVGVMCHIVHSKPARDPTHASSAYANVALPRMYTLLRARGIEPLQCEAYVYGGGNMFPHIYTSAPVGDNNAQWALQALMHDGIPVLLHDLGGSSYRRLKWTVGPQTPQVTAVAV
jgi:chemotaxis protein CheD